MAASCSRDITVSRCFKIKSHNVCVKSVVSKILSYFQLYPGVVMEVVLFCWIEVWTRARPLKLSVTFLFLTSSFLHTFGECFRLLSCWRMKDYWITQRSPEGSHADSQIHYMQLYAHKYLYLYFFLFCHFCPILDPWLINISYFNSSSEQTRSEIMETLQACRLFSHSVLCWWPEQ